MVEAKSIVEKTLERVSGEKDLQTGDVTEVKPDLIVMYNWPGFINRYAEVLEDELDMEKVPNPERMIIPIDHNIPPNNPEEAEFNKFHREWAEKQGIETIEGEGIGHQVMAERGLARPGKFIAHGDVHVHVLGVLGLLCYTLLGDLISAYATGEIWVEVPEVIKFDLAGELEKGVMARDLWYSLVSEFGTDAAAEKIITFDGDGIQKMSVDERMSLCGFPSMMGAITAMVEPDSLLEKFLNGRGEKEENNLKRPEYYRSDSNYEFAKEYEYNLEDTEPKIVCHPRIDKIKPLTGKEGLEIQQGYIGSCGSGRLEDIRIAGEILEGQEVKDDVRLNIVPSSNEVFRKALREGLIQKLVDSGAFISSPSCNYCYGGTQALAKGERAIGTGWMNVPGRMGSTEAEIYIGSSASVAASAIEGSVTDPRKYL